MTRAKRLLIKFAVALVVLTGLGFLFMRSVRGTRAQPYTVAPESLRNWTLAFEPAAGPGDPILVLRPPAALVSGLFHQVFRRAMESMNAPAAPAIPLLLRGEFDRAFAGRVTPEALLGAARDAGLDHLTLLPQCLGHRRRSEPGSTEQLYFVLFDAPAHLAFRERARGLLGGGVPLGDFDPAAQSPVLFIAVAESTFNRWLPLRADPKADCVAPIVTSSQAPD